jgi:hypothetical protein
MAEPLIETVGPPDGAAASHGTDGANAGGRAESRASDGARNDSRDAADMRRLTILAIDVDD